MNGNSLPGVQVDPHVRELADALIEKGVVSKDSKELAPSKLAEAFSLAVKECCEGNWSRRRPDYSELWDE